MNSSSTTQSLRSMRDVLRPRFGGEGEGEGLDGFLGVNWTTGGRALAVIGEIGVSSKFSLDLFAGKNTVDDGEAERPARDSKAAIFAWTVAEDIEAAEKGGLAGLFSAVTTIMSSSTNDLYAVAGTRCQLNRLSIANLHSTDFCLIPIGTSEPSVRTRSDRQMLS